MPRKAGFATEQILESAMLVFWQRGYRGTSMRDLVTATELHPGSIYHSFGNKKQFFIEVTDYYYKQLTREINANLTVSTSAGKVLSAFFTSFIARNQYPEVRGCLLVNTLMECSDDPDIQAHIAAMFTGFEEMFYWILVKGQKHEDFKADIDCRLHAQALVNDYFGMRVQSLTEKSEDELLSMVDFRLKQLGFSG